MYHLTHHRQNIKIDTSSKLFIKIFITQTLIGILIRKILILYSLFINDDHEVIIKISFIYLSYQLIESVYLFIWDKIQRTKFKNLIKFFN